MGTGHVDLDPDIVALLEAQDRPIQETARELIVLELYRQGQLSSGRGAELLHLSRHDFIRYAWDRGIPYFQLEGDDLRRELDESRSLS
jgi:predicted HTH domain antitoxin